MYRAFRPVRVDLARSNVFNVRHKRYAHILGRLVRQPKVHRDVFRHNGRVYIVRHSITSHRRHTGENRHRAVNFRAASRVAHAYIVKRIRHLARRRLRQRVIRRGQQNVAENTALVRHPGRKPPRAVRKVVRHKYRSAGDGECPLSRIRLHAQRARFGI